MYRFNFLIVVIVILSSCGAPTLHNPSSTLKETGRSTGVHIQAMEMLDESVGVEDKNYHKQLQRMLWIPGYTNEVRNEALKRLWAFDREGTTRIIRQQLPRIGNWSWLTELCQWIAEEQLTELNEALISSWANPTSLAQTEKDRPEYIALRQMYGEEQIADLIFETMLAANRAWKQGYRTRCWELLHRLGQRERLVLLLEQTQFDNEDLFFLDLQRAKSDLGIVPHRREEILWIRELAKEEYVPFWNEAKVALANLGNERRDTVEMRDVPIAVSLQRHGGKNAFSRSTNSMLNQIALNIKDEKHYSETEGGGLFSVNSERFHTHKNKLTWGDAATLEILLTALNVPEVKAHLFDYAKRDNLDESTEYGGVIALDEKGRFEILEFEPKVRTHDRRFNASQDMFDAAYTALFHFHFHAQKLRNGDHAGPGMGDKNYANNTRANCLVFTFINENKMNVDFYRHGGVVIDVGTISIE